MTYQFDLSQPVGCRVKEIKIGGSSLEPAKTYSVTGNEFLLAALTSPLFNIPVSDVYVYPDSTEFQVVVDYVVAKGFDQLVSVKKENDSMVREFGILQNYPNSFNPTTVISYRLKTAGKTTLKIYNQLGQEVATLVN